MMKKLILSLIILCTWAGLASAVEFSISQKSKFGYYGGSTWPPTSGTFYANLTGLSSQKFKNAYDYDDYCGLIRFDTSSIPDGATVSSATLKIKKIGSGTTNNIYADYYAWDGSTPISSDYTSSQDGTAAIFDYNSTSDYHAISLSNVSNISKISYTSIRIRTSSASPVDYEYCGDFNVTDSPPVLTVTYTTPPGTPGNPTFTNVAHKSMTISWTAATGATSYTLQRGGSNISTSAISPYDDTGLAVNTSYTYRVIAVNADGSTNCAADQSQATTYYDKSFNGSGAIKTINGVYVDTLNGQN